MAAMQTVEIADGNDGAGDVGGQNPAADQVELVGHHVFFGPMRRDRGGFGPHGQGAAFYGHEDLNDFSHGPLKGAVACGAGQFDKFLPVRPLYMAKSDTNQTVLIIDPSGVITRVLTVMLTELGWGPVETVPTPVEALTQLREKRFGLVLTDWATEPMDAGEFMKSLRADAALAAIPVMIVTGNPDPSQYILANDAGADAYALVPFDIETLALKLDQIRLRKLLSPS